MSTDGLNNDRHSSNRAATENTSNIFNSDGGTINLVQQPQYHFNTRDSEGRKNTREIADWISPENHRQDQINKGSTRTPGTGQWLLEDPRFLDWRSQDTSTLLIRGNPGSGKTYLMSTVNDSLLEEYSKLNIPILFLFCQHDNRKSGQDIVRTYIAVLLRQLFERHREATLHDLHGEIKRHQDEKTEPSETELFSWLEVALRGFAKAIITLDALDEVLNARDRLRLLKYLLSLKRNLLVSSRPMDKLETILLPSAILLQFRANYCDLEMFVNKKISDDPDLSALLPRGDIRDQVVTELKLKCDGMFLLAALQMTELACCVTFREVRQCLAKLPSSLDGMFNHTWNRILQQNAATVSRAKKTIIWLMCHARSEPFTMDMLRHALAAHDDTGLHDSDDVLPESTAFKLITACYGLVIREKEVVQLCHYSALQFFERNSHLVTDSSLHLIPANACIGYLLHSGFHQLDVRRHSDRSITVCHPFRPELGKVECWNNLKQFLRQTTYPLLAYAYRWWAYHVRQCGDNAEVTQRVIAFLGNLKNPSRYPLDIGLDLDYEICEPLNAGTRLHIAAQYGLQSVIPTPCQDINGLTSGRKQTPLHLAALHGHRDLAECLLSLGANVNLRDDMDHTPLNHAAAEGHEDVVRLLLCQPNIDVNRGDKLRRTPLHQASSWGHTGCVRALLECPNVSPNQIDKRGFSPIARAIYWDNFEIVQELAKDLRTDLNVRHNIRHWHEETTPLILAVSMGRLEMVRLLLKFANYSPITANKPTLSSECDAIREHLDINAVNKEGETALLVIVRQDGRTKDTTSVTTIPRQNNLSIVKLLLQHGIDPNVQQKWGLSALMVAAKSGNLAVVISLLASKDIDVNMKAPRGWTALHHAVASHKHEAVVQALLSDSRTDVNACSELGKTPLVICIQRGLKSVISSPAMNSPDIDTHEDVAVSELGREGDSVRTNDDRSTIIKGHARIAAMLLEVKATDVDRSKDKFGVSVFIMAAAAGRVDLLRLLLKRISDLNARDPNGDTALIRAAGEGHLDVVRLLIEAPGIDIEARNGIGDTALVRAATRGRVDTMHALLQSGARIDHRNKAGETVLMRAARVGAYKSVRALSILPSADINAVDTHQSETALIKAARTGHVETVAALLEHPDTDVNYQEKKLGWSPLMWAVHGGHRDCVEIILRDGRRVDVNARDMEGDTVLMKAAIRDNSDIVQMLLTNGQADSTLGRKLDGNTALMMAVASHKHENAKLIVAHNHCTIDVTNNRGETALFQSAKKGREGAVALLCSLGANVDIPEHRFKGTALMSAAYHGHESIVERLLAAGADPSLRNRRGRTACDEAIQNNKASVAERLTAVQSNEDTLVHDPLTSPRNVPRQMEIRGIPRKGRC